MLILNPTIANNGAYTALAQSAIEYQAGDATKTITGGCIFAGGYLESGNASTGSSGSIAADIKNAMTLGSTIAGASDVVALCFRPVGGNNNVDCEGSITWRELS